MLQSDGLKRQAGRAEAGTVRTRAEVRTKISIRVRIKARIRVSITVLDYCILMAEMIICTGRHPHFSIEKFGYYPLSIM